MAEAVPLRQVTGVADLADSGSVHEEAAREGLYTGKTAAVARAQAEGLVTDALASAHLVFRLIALASFWSAAPQMVRMLPVAQGGDSREQRREAVVHAARRIAAPEGR
ncbi:hypothetical protein JOF53_001130 [Crossiella equi]|uniref:HTH-type transcriptional repressor Sco4008 C-terminal domain-containing protein n=1 Tax=Crossiella equi TaxID=130796 RepID=A0ABS5A6N6_9PSEU|nr:hypothetical protein [Crossiella equi]MBP2472258.1 hypothetical protein [Crossiella equi]